MSLTINTSAEKVLIVDVDGNALQKVAGGGIPVTQVDASGNANDSTHPSYTQTTDLHATGNITTVDLVCATNANGLITGTPTAGSFLTLALPDDESELRILLSGFTGGKFQFERSIDAAGTTYMDMSLFGAGGSRQSNTVNVGAYSGNVTASAFVRVRAITAVTGTCAVVVEVGRSPGTVTAVTFGLVYATQIDYNGGTNPVYIGEAGPGIAATVGIFKWRIKKLVYDASGNVTSIQWAGGSDSFTNDWTLRAGLSYS